MADWHDVLLQKRDSCVYRTFFTYGWARKQCVWMWHWIPTLRAALLWVGTRGISFLFPFFRFVLCSSRSQSRIVYRPPLPNIVGGIIIKICGVCWTKKSVEKSKMIQSRVVDWWWGKRETEETSATTPRLSVCRSRLAARKERERAIEREKRLLLDFTSLFIPRVSIDLHTGYYIFNSFWYSWCK